MDALTIQSLDVLLSISQKTSPSLIDVRKNIQKTVYEDLLRPLSPSKFGFTRLLVSVSKQHMQ